MLIFKFLVSKGSSTSLFLMLTPLSHQTNCCYPRKTYSSTLVPLPKMPLSTLFLSQLLVMESFFYHLGFSSTVTISFKILLDRNNHFFLWVPTTYCSNLYSAYQSAFYFSFLSVCHYPPFQIISSLIIGTVSYSFLCLSQYLSCSRHSL